MVTRQTRVNQRNWKADKSYKKSITDMDIIFCTNVSANVIQILPSFNYEIVFWK
jgi:hypothetical protein